MPIQLTTPQTHHAPAIARILFDSFNHICTTHGHPTDFPTLEMATDIASSLISRPDVLGILALDVSGADAPVGMSADGTRRAPENARIVGSNFAMIGDDIAGIGPISVDLPYQSQGIGKRLMQTILDQCRSHQKPNIRLLQDTFNRASLSLYASLGFQVQEPIADILTLPNAAPPDPTIRRATLADVPALSALYHSLTGLSRQTELTHLIQVGSTTLLRERQGKPVAYLIATIFGHGIAQTNADALALAQQLANLSPDGNHFMLPLRNHDLFSQCLAAGMRTTKLMNLMSIGHYHSPTATWLPSIDY